MVATGQSICVANDNHCTSLAEVPQSDFAVIFLLLVNRLFFLFLPYI
jgi:hypothetical protein